MSQSNIAGLMMCVIGLCLNAFPTAIWRLSEKWKSEGASAPSEKYITTLCILSGALIGFGVLLACGIIR